MAASFFTRLRWRIRLYIIKVFVSIFVASSRLINAKPNQRPTYSKYYPVRKSLICHVWIPSSYKAGSSPPLPLLIDIHGGGFCIGHPTIDNGDNAILCHKYGICIVSISYRLAPAYPFPTPPQDAAALIDAILNDPDLPVDKNKVAVCGYSAGGTLSLSAPQLNGLHKRIKGTVAYYPATAPGRPLAEKLKAATPPPGRQDLLIGMAPAFNWAYIPEGQDLHDPLLAPLYAKRENLPEKLFIMGCEYDLLCTEAREMADKMADAEGGKERKELGEGRVGWQCGNVTWEELKGMEHGFNQRKMQESDQKLLKLWTEKTEEMHANVAKWLFQEVYA
jgi:acetyl esterase/lipase